MPIDHQPGQAAEGHGPPAGEPAGGDATIAVTGPAGDATTSPPSDERYRDLFDLAPEPYLLTDVDGRIRLVNTRAVQLLDAPRAEIDGHDLAEFLAPASRGGFQRQLARVADGRSIHAWEVHLAGATSPTVLASVEPYPGPNGAMELRWVLWDALPLELIRGRLSRLLEDSQGDAATLRALAQWQASLLGSAAQDMRTPLAVITSTLDSLLADGAQVGTPVARAMLERAHRQALRLRRLLPTLLQLGRLQLESPGANRHHVSLPRLVDEVLHDLDPLGRPVAFAFTVDQVHVDARRLARVLVELVTHANDHGPDASPMRIGAEPRGVDAELFLEVAGYRVPEDVRQVVFAPFAGTVDDEQGDREDLGLALVAVFARMHGGRAWVQDAPDGSSSFRVLLSNALPDADPRVDVPNGQA